MKCLRRARRSQTTNSAGQLLRRVTDTSGAVIELTLDSAGRIINSRIVSQATGTGTPPRP